MLFFVIIIVQGLDIKNLLACLHIVKWKISSDERSFDYVLAGSTVNHEKVLDKVIGNMLEHCEPLVSPDVSDAVFLPTTNLQEFEDLLGFEFQSFQNETEVELSQKQQEILDMLEKYLQEINSGNYYNIFLIVSFSAVIVYVAGVHYTKYLNPKKWFKLE
jgi:hypothetical protein